MRLCCVFVGMVFVFLQQEPVVFFFFRYWFAPVGVSIGIKNSRAKVAPPNPVLEKAYQQCKKMKHKQVLNNFLFWKIFFRNKIYRLYFCEFFCFFLWSKTY